MTYTDVLDRLRTVSQCEPIDWQAIRGIYLNLSTFASTAAQKNAARRLKEANCPMTLRLSLVEVERAFGPNVDPDGWPIRR